jgi:hypothetical protein
VVSSHCSHLHALDAAAAPLYLSSSLSPMRHFTSLHKCLAADVHRSKAPTRFNMHSAPLFSVRKHFFIWALPCGLPPMYCCPACKKPGWQSSYWRVFHICAESLDPLDVHERKRLSRVATTHPLRRPRVGRICHAIQNVTAILVFMLILVRAP